MTRRRSARLAAAHLGRLRGGLTTKIRLAIGHRLPAPGRHRHRRAGRRQPPVHPRPGEDQSPWAGRQAPRPTRAVAADEAYSSWRNRTYLRRRGIKAMISEPRDQATNRKKKGSSGGRPVTCDPDLYRERNTVERGINKFKAWRGLAGRYDKDLANYQADLEFRATLLWIPSLKAKQ